MVLCEFGLFRVHKPGEDEKTVCYEQHGVVWSDVCAMFDVCTGVWCQQHLIAIHDFACFRFVAGPRILGRQNFGLCWVAWF